MKTLGGKFGLISSRQKLRCRYFYYVSQLTGCVRKQKKKSLIIGAPRPFLCLSGLFMLTSAHVPFYACRAFLCLSADELLQFMHISVWKKWSRLISKRLSFQERSVQFEFSLPPKSQMVPFRLISLMWSLLVPVVSYWFWGWGKVFLLCAYLAS